MNIEVGVKEGCIWQSSQMCHLDIFGLSRASHESQFNVYINLH